MIYHFGKLWPSPLGWHQWFGTWRSQKLTRAPKSLKKQSFVKYKLAQTSIFWKRHKASQKGCNGWLNRNFWIRTQNTFFGKLSLKLWPKMKNFTAQKVLRIWFYIKYGYFFQIFPNFCQIFAKFCQNSYVLRQYLSCPCLEWLFFPNFAKFFQNFAKILIFWDNIIVVHV